jgi:Spy/CpxP family protein refolding chaperone
MKMSRVLLGAALLGAFSLAVISETGAQLGGGGGGGRRGGGSRDSGGERSETTRLSANDQIRMQLTNARLALKLAPEQNPPWQSYEDKVIALIAEQPQSASENAVKQIDRNAELLRSRLGAMQDLADAAKKLYATLSDDQKVVAERMLGTTVPPAYAGRGTGPR